MVTLVVAGPGTGKTTFITNEIRKLLEKGTGPSRILALTFTEKAADEMLTRLDEAMPLGYEPPWISTFHSFCDRILRQEGLEIGLDPAYKVISEPEAWLLLRRNLFDLPLEYFRPLGNPTKFLSALLQLFSRAKDEEVTPEDYLEWAKRKGQKAKSREEKEEAIKQIELAKVYTAYQKLLIKNSYLDFGDLIFWTIKLFKQRPSILKRYQDQFRYIFVDEFQDTNAAQFSLVRFLAPAEVKTGLTAGRSSFAGPTNLTVGRPGSSAGPSNLTVVGDDDQAIYKWRGASVSNILEFKKSYPSCQTKVLRTSYRLTDELARKSYRLIQNNNPDRLEVKLQNVSKKLKTLKRGPAPYLLYARSAEEETELVLRKIVELVNTEGRNFSDFAILARANAHLDPFIAALKRHELPYQVVGNRGLFEQEEVAALLAVLRVIKDPNDTISWYKILNAPAFKISAEKVLGLLNRAQKTHVPLVEILREEKNSVLALISDLARDSFRVSPSHLLFDFVQKSGYVQELTKAPTLTNQLQVENIALFFQKVHQFEAEVREPNVPELVDYLDLLIEAGESPAQAVVEDVDTINLMTVHSAKGLEFPVVFLVSLTSDRFPTRQRSAALGLPEHFVKEFRYLKKSHKGGGSGFARFAAGEPSKGGGSGFARFADLPAEASAQVGGEPSDEEVQQVGHLQEERRLFYVAVTRASEQLFLSLAQNYGGVQEKRPSRFLRELGVEVPPATPERLATRPTRFATRSGRVAGGALDIEGKPLDLSVLIPKKFSYSQIDDYRDCPWKYRYKYVLKIPAPPTPPTSFGISLHETLREFELRQMRGEKVSLPQFLKIYRDHFLSEGYRDRKEKEAYLKRGQKLLTDFYRRDQKKLLPAWAVEKGFEIKIGGKTVRGRIDRIGKDNQGRFELIDFKGGDTAFKEEGDLSKKAQKDDQLLLYTIAAKEALGITPHSVALFYLDGGKRVEAQFSEGEIEKRKKEIAGLLGKISAGEFKATPGFVCAWCPFNKICEFSQSDRYR
ncbi:MAG: ATP-dependent DNA helicase [candidate division WWE3 bacterium]|nr:ATP-dependent DNA helicase [candidate division WWE3 bacterium]